MHFWTKALHKHTISVTTEPFLRSVLITKYQSQLWQLQRRARIEVPTSMGRIMLGTVDETSTLKYGQVFIQYSNKLDKPQDLKKVHTGKVMVTKNPCFHPGDMRKFDAIDVPALHHMIDCIVFPSQGHRPHPNEMSGSDLDGDMYFVLWDQSFIIPKENVDPMDFPSAVKELKSTITENDLAEFVVTYIKNDQLGLIANAHCCEAEINEKGIFSQKCLDLAKMHSEAVDFPKTGVCPKLPADLRPMMYPRFLMKYDKPSCNSTAILGKLFDQCSAVAKANKAYKGFNRPVVNVRPDRSLLANGFEDYVDNALIWRDYYNSKIYAMMNLYGIESEAEILSGYVLKVKEQRGILKNERVDVCKLVAAKMKQLRKQIRVEFFEEFEGQSSAVSSQERLCEAVRKASAWYFVCYDPSSQEPNAIQFLSMPWIVADILLLAKELNEGKIPVYDKFIDAQTDKDGLLPDEYAKSGLSLIFINMSNLTTRYDDYKAKICNQFGKMLASLLDQWQQIPHLTVLPLSEQGDCLLADEEILMMCKVNGNTPYQGIINVMFDKAKAIDMSARRSKKHGGHIITIGQEPLEIRILLKDWHEVQYRRALYISQSKKSSNILHICLPSLVEWGKHTRLTGDGRKSTIGTYELCLLFISYIEERFHTSKPDREKYGMQWKDLSSCPLNISDKAEQTIIAEAFLSFLKEYGSKCTTATSLENIQDPANRDTLLLDYMVKDNAKKMHFSDAILNAYHITAHSFSIVPVEEEGVIDKEHLRVPLSTETIASVWFAEAYTAKRMSALTGAMVSITRHTFNDQSLGLMLEAFGDREAIHRVQQAIAVLEDKSAKILHAKSQISNRPMVRGAYQRVFEGSRSVNDLIVFPSYSGPKQNEHEELVTVTPKLQHACSTMQLQFCFEEIDAMFTGQLSQIQNNYDPNYEGTMEMCISFGILYFVNVNWTSTSIEKLRNEEAHGDNFQDMYKGRARGRGRGFSRGRSRGYRGRHIGPPRQAKLKSSFYPKHLEDVRNLEEFLLNQCFTKVETAEKFGISTHAGKSGSMKSGMKVVLDKDQQFVKLELPSYKWLVLDMKRHSNTTNSDREGTVPDMRLQVISDRAVLPQEMALIPQYKHLVAYAENSIVEYQDTVKVCGGNRYEFYFIRHKQVTVYQYNRHTSDEFMKNMKIKVSMVKEYSKPDENGVFRHRTPKRTEIKIYPEVPRDMHDDDKWRETVDNVWKFALKMANALWGP